MSLLIAFYVGNKSEEKNPTLPTLTVAPEIETNRDGMIVFVN